MLKKERNQGYFQDLDLSNQDEWWPFLEMGNLWGGTLFFFTALIIDWHIWFFFFCSFPPLEYIFQEGMDFLSFICCCVLETLIKERPAYSYSVNIC